MDIDITRRRALVGMSIASIASIALGGVAVSSGLGDTEEETTETITETYEAEEMSVRADIGSVSIAGEDRSTIELDIAQSGTEGALDRTTLQRNEKGQTLEVTVEYGQSALEQLGIVLNPEPEVEINLAVPVELAGAVLETDDSVNVRGVETDLEISTGNGDIDVENASSVNGLTSTNGEIDVDVEALNDDAAIETTNGNITISTDALRWDVTVETTNGDVEFGLGSSSDATLSASTTNGDLSITTDRAEVLTDTDGELEAVVDDGTHRVEFETTNGDVTIGN